MALDTFPTNDPQGPTHSVPARSRTERLGRIVVWILLVGLIAEIVLEASSRIGYDKSLAAVKERMRNAGQEQKKLTAADAAGLMSGWPKTSERQSQGRKETEFRWPSLIWDLRIHLQCDPEQSVVQVSIGSGEVQSVEPTGQPSPGQPAATPAKGALWLARGSAEGSPAALLLAKRGTGILPESTEKGRLLHELARQGLLLTARDELGLPTRDAILGERLPDVENAVIPRLLVLTSIDARRHGLVRIERELQSGGSAEVRTCEFQVGPGTLIAELATKIEALSVSEFVATLQKAGLSGKGHGDLTEGQVPADIANQLSKFELLAQWGALRALHSEVRESGESPDRLAALARGYAQLGTLSQFLWGGESKVYHARGLLYAERLYRKAGGNSRALWQRGYVRALVGLHQAALEDLTAARADQATPAPEWAPALDAFCRGDLTQLARLSKRKRGPALPQFLCLLATAQSPVRSVRLSSALAMLKTQPECELAYVVALDEAALGVQRQMSGSAVAQFSATVRSFLEANQALPDDVRKLAAGNGGELKDEMENLVQVITALQAVGGVDRDVGEPSLGALASLIQEVAMASTSALLYVEKFALAVDTAETLAAVKPVFKGHAYEKFADVHITDHAASYEALKALRTSQPNEPYDLGARPVINLFRMYWSQSDEGMAILTPMYEQAVRHSDATFNDLVRALRIPAATPVKQGVARTLREVSPGSSLGVGAAIDCDWERSEPSAGAWEKEYADDIGVQGALAARFTELKRFEDAVRCRKRQLELLPEQDVFLALANLYREHGDEELWIETLKESLEAPSLGLEHARAHSELAYHYMRRKEWDQARPHAEQAAASYSGWGLMCAAELEEKTGNWQRANRYRRMNAERYTDGSAGLSWYFWCQETGHGDVQAARKLARDRIAKIKDWPRADERDQVGLFYVLEDQPAEAIEAFRAAAQLESSNAYHYLHAALLADELGQNDLRDAQLTAAHARGISQNNYLVEIVNAFQYCFDSGSNQLDLKLVEWAIRDRASSGSITNELYFVGKFLALRGRDQESREYLQRSATSVFHGKYNSKMAAHALIKAGVALGERRETELDAAAAKQLETLQRANKVRDAGEWDQALPIYNELILADPDFVNAWYDRGQGYNGREDFAAAIADLTRALELVPGCAAFLVLRGRAQEYLGQYTAAIRDYEQAVQVDPRRALAYYNLAFLRAACPEAEFRNGGDAQKYARLARTFPEVAGDLGLQLLAAADAQAGQFDEARKHQTESMNAAPAARKELAKERLALYERGQPYHRQPGWWRRK